MIEPALQRSGTLAPDEQALAIITAALAKIASSRPALRREAGSLWNGRGTSWRFSGRTWAGPAHDGRDRPRR